MILDPSFINSAIQFLAGFSIVFLVVLWISLILWTFRDIRRRSRDPLLRILAVILTIILFIPGALVYVLLRPGQTLEEEYQRNLEEETLLQSLEESPLCPGCSCKVKNDWLVCPTCRTQLSKKCVSCGKILELSWEICPYCETVTSGYHRSNISIDDLVSQNIVKVDFNKNTEE